MTHPVAAVSPASALHPPASTSPRALWTAIGGLALSVVALGGTMLYQHRSTPAPAPMAAVQPVLAPAATSKQKVAATPAPSAQAATNSIAGRRVPAPPVAFAVEPVRAPATARPAPRRS